MKNNLVLITSIFTATLFSAQNLKFTPLLEDQISVRAIQIAGGKVWYAGTNSKFGYIDINNTKDQKQWRLSSKDLQFRTLAQDKLNFYTVNIESPAYFFKIDKKTLSPQIVYTDTLKTAFYDALKFEKNGKGIALGDPAGKCMSLVITKDFGKNWQKLSCANVPNISVGEAAFAASNSNIFLNKKQLWFVTGGQISKQYYSKNFGKTIESKVIPFVDGSSSTGIYATDMCPAKQFGIVVGGDYTKQNENINNIATTFDNGKSWQIQASGKNAGYMTAVKIRPASDGKEIIAVGDQHISYSSDFGKAWIKISAEKNLYTVEWLNQSTLIFAGKNKILKAEISF